MRKGWTAPVFSHVREPELCLLSRANREAGSQNFASDDEQNICDRKGISARCTEAVSFDKRTRGPGEPAHHTNSPMAVYSRRGIFKAMSPPALDALGMDGSAHTQRCLTREMLDHYDVVVGMADDHIELMRTKFNYKYGILFNELAQNEKTSVTDIDEIPDFATNRPAVEEKLRRTVQDITGKVPSVFERISERFYLFSDFVAGEITDHSKDGLPFIALHETLHSVAFMSVDIPATEDGHVLVIPKKRYPDLIDVPDEVLEDMLASIKK